MSASSHQEALVLLTQSRSIWSTGTANVWMYSYRINSLLRGRSTMARCLRQTPHDACCVGTEQMASWNTVKLTPLNGILHKQQVARMSEAKSGISCPHG